MNYIKWTYTTYKVDGAVDVVQDRYWPYVDAKDCAQGLADFNALSIDQQLAESGTVEPVLPAGKIRRIRGCSGGVAGADEPWTPDADNGPSLVDETGGSTPGPLPSDGSAWTQGNPGDKDDQGNDVTFSPPVIL